MQIKRYLKDSYKKMLVFMGESPIGNQVGTFLCSSASVIMEQVGKVKRNEISERLMVKKLVASPLEQSVYSKKNEYQICASSQSDPAIIKIRVVHCAPQFFGGIKTLCEEYLHDQRYNLKIILVNDTWSSYELSEQMINEGIDYTFENDYDFSVDRPDITIFYLLEYSYTKKILEARIYSRMLLLVPQTLTTIWYGDRTISRLHLDKFKPDIVFASKLAIGKLRKYAPAYKFVEMIPPRLDIIYRNLEKTACNPAGWEKLKNKKVIMYMSDHGLTQHATSDEMTFDLYLPILMDYIKANGNEEVGLIIRPHFALIRELLAYFWDLDDYHSFVSYCEKSPNIVWDESRDFSTALSLCDAILSDVNSSVTYFSLAAKKPIAVALRYDMPVELFNKEFTYGLGVVQSKEDCIHFLDMVKEGKVTWKESQEKLFDELISPFDGKNGQRVKEKIESEYAKII